MTSFRKIEPFSVFVPRLLQFSDNDSSLQLFTPLDSNLNKYLQRYRRVSSNCLSVLNVKSISNYFEQETQANLDYSSLRLVPTFFIAITSIYSSRECHIIRIWKKIHKFLYKTLIKILSIKKKEKKTHKYHNIYIIVECIVKYRRILPRQATSNHRKTCSLTSILNEIKQGYLQRYYLSLRLKNKVWTKIEDTRSRYNDRLVVHDLTNKPARNDKYACSQIFDVKNFFHRAYFAYYLNREFFFSVSSCLQFHLL